MDLLYIIFPISFAILFIIILLFVYYWSYDITDPFDTFHWILYSLLIILGIIGVILIIFRVKSSDSFGFIPASRRASLASDPVPTEFVDGASDRLSRTSTSSTTRLGSSASHVDSSIEVVGEASASSAESVDVSESSVPPEVPLDYLSDSTRGSLTGSSDPVPIDSSISVVGSASRRRASSVATASTSAIVSRRGSVASVRPSSDVDVDVALAPDEEPSRSVSRQRSTGSTISVAASTARDLIEETRKSLKKSLSKALALESERCLTELAKRNEAIRLQKEADKSKREFREAVQALRHINNVNRSLVNTLEMLNNPDVSLLAPGFTSRCSMPREFPSCSL